MTMTWARRRQSRSGLVLVVVLWTAIMLLVMVSVLAQYSRLNMKLSVFSAQSVRCRWVSRAGLETAIALLYEDGTASDTLSDLWSDNDEDLVDISVNNASFTVRIVDEAGKMNINTVSKEQLMTLDTMTEPIADSIIDWRDNDDTPQDNGVETGYYRNLTYPYTARNGPFKTLRELLLVKGVTKELLYGEDTNLNGQLDYNERDGDQSPPHDNQDEVLDTGWIAFLTCYSKDDDKDADGLDRVKINQASQQELEQQLGIRSSYARWIVDNRGNGFDSLGDLIAGDSPDEPRDSSGDSDQAESIDLQTLQQIIDRVTLAGDNDNAARPKVNVNTAPKEVLMMLFPESDNDESLALNIISYRESLLLGMESIGDLLNVSGMTRDLFKQIVDQVTVRSNVFTGATVVTEAVVDRAASPDQVIYWYQGADY